MAWIWKINTVVCCIWNIIMLSMSGVCANSMCNVHSESTWVTFRRNAWRRKKNYLKKSCCEKPENHTNNSQNAKAISSHVHNWHSALSVTWTSLECVFFLACRPQRYRFSQACYTICVCESYLLCAGGNTAVLLPVPDNVSVVRLVLCIYTQFIF